MRDVSILIVDDTATARNMVRSTLQNNFGTETLFTAADGKEALEILRQHRVDIIVSDWNMTVRNFSTRCARTRRPKKFPSS